MTKKLTVWWMPQIPMKTFDVEVESVKEAVKLMDTLALYDLFQFENNVKPDFSNTGGIKMIDENGEEVEWFTEIKDDAGDVVEYFDNPRDYLQYLEDNGLAEE